MVKLSKVSKTYKEGDQHRVIFHGLDIVFERERTTAIKGRSGTGKSTLLNLVSGIDVPDTGDISVDGRSLTSLSEHHRTLFRRKAIGFIFQFFNLIPTLTVAENVLLPLQLNGWSGEHALADVKTLLARVGLAERAESYPDVLSGGEQQRVAIARALVHRPSLILADEPTGNLDAKTGEDVMALLCELVRDTHATLLIVTHSAEVERVADRVVSIDNGAVVERR